MDTNPIRPAEKPQESPSPDPSSPAHDGAVPAAATTPAAEGSPSLAAHPGVSTGSERLYAVARWLVYVFMGLILYTLLNSVLYSLRPRLSGTLWLVMAVEAQRVVAAILPAFVMARIEGRSFGDYGLPAKGAFGRNFSVGSVWGIGGLSILMLGLRAAGAFTFGSLRLHGAHVFKIGVFYAVFFLIVAIFEEFMTRGYSQWVLSRSINFWPAAVVLSLGFGAIHLLNPGEDKTGLAAIVLMGLFWCFTLWRTGNLWWAVGFHAAWDWGESFFYSVPDSGGVAPARLLNSSLHGPDWLTGGSVGPEGSYLVFALIAGVWFLFSRVYPEVKYGVRRADTEQM